MRIGWLSDSPIGHIVGGAELSSATLAACPPEGVEVVACPPHEIAADVDFYVVQNAKTYGALDTLPYLFRRPVIHQVRDVWEGGDPVLRSYLLHRSDLLLFSSLPHVEQFPHPHHDRIRLVPPPLDPKPFIQAKQQWEASGKERSGVLFLSNMLSPQKGVHNVIEWAIRNQTPVDFYGAGEYAPNTESFGGFANYKGALAYAETPAVYARYKTFILLPQSIEPFGRVAAEADAAGCELVLNEQVGALWWFNHHPDLVWEGLRIFWDTVQEFAESSNGLD